MLALHHDTSSKKGKARSTIAGKRQMPSKEHESKRIVLQNKEMIKLRASVVHHDVVGKMNRNFVLRAELKTSVVEIEE